MGILLCTGKHDPTARYASASTEAPVAVAEYRVCPSESARRCPAPGSGAQSTPRMESGAGRQALMFGVRSRARAGGAGDARVCLSIQTRFPGSTRTRTLHAAVSDGVGSVLWVARPQGHLEVESRGIHMKRHRVSRWRRAMVAGATTMLLLTSGGAVWAAVTPGVAPTASGCTTGPHYTIRSDGYATASWTNCASTSTRMQPQWHHSSGYTWGDCKVVTPMGTTSWTRYWASVAQWRGC